MARIITGTHGRINNLIAGIPNDEILALVSSADGKLSVLVKSDGLIGTPIPEGTEAYDKQIAEMAKALEDCKLRCEKEIEAKDLEINSLKVQVGTFTEENAKLNKDLDKKSKDFEKLSKELEKVKNAFKALE